MTQNKCSQPFYCVKETIKSIVQLIFSGIYLGSGIRQESSKRPQPMVTEIKAAVQTDQALCPEFLLFCFIILSTGQVG